VTFVLKALETRDGAGVKLRRAFGDPLIAYETDPFLLLDDFGSRYPHEYLAGFPWHPHRGFETITYVIKGEVHHEDSTGIKGVLRDEDVQWVTAGESPARLILLTGRPIGEPIAWYGPIVMNTKEELIQAFKELREGTFVKHRPTEVDDLSV
jgi:redox-sensitive bicupin YhaK (pirin superfamily)